MQNDACHPSCHCTLKMFYVYCIILDMHTEELTSTVEWSTTMKENTTAVQGTRHTAHGVSVRLSISFLIVIFVIIF